GLPALPETVMSRARVAVAPVYCSVPAVDPDPSVIAALPVPSGWLEPLAATALTESVPALTATAPPNEFVPDSATVPVPAWVSDPVPEMTPVTARLPVRLNVSAALLSTSPGRFPTEPRA